MCKIFFTNFFLKLWVTSVKPTYQIWIHVGHREKEGTLRRVRAGVGASARVHMFAQQMVASRTHRFMYKDCSGPRWIILNFCFEFKSELPINIS